MLTCSILLFFNYSLLFNLSLFTLSKRLWIRCLNRAYSFSISPLHFQSSSSLICHSPPFHCHSSHSNSAFEASTLSPNKAITVLLNFEYFQPLSSLLFVSNRDSLSNRSNDTNALFEAVCHRRHKANIPPPQCDTLVHSLLYIDYNHSLRYITMYYYTNATYLYVIYL